MLSPTGPYNGSCTLIHIESPLVPVDGPPQNGERDQTPPLQTEQAPVGLHNGRASPHENRNGFDASSTLGPDAPSDRASKNPRTLHPVSGDAPTSNGS